MKLFRLFLGLSPVGIEFAELLDDDGLIEPHMVTEIDPCGATGDNQFSDFIAIF